MSDGQKSARILGDNPIRDPRDDVLERASIAEGFARHVLDLDVSEGAVVGVFGPWGSGKTSFVNLARTAFDHENVPVLDFNPWLFSGADQLVGRFFAELPAQMKETKGLGEFGKAIARYGDALSGPAGVLANFLGGPVAQKIVEAGLKSVGQIDHSSESIVSLRKKIVGALQDSDNPMIVVLDDVDRLSGPEIREVFKLVRLTANFPNVIYIVPCDRLRIEQALSEKEYGLSGRDYLEKIVQWSFDLPSVPRHLLMQHLDQAIENALSDIENAGPFYEDTWLDVREEIIRPLIRNVRDIRRYAVAIKDTVGGLDGGVARVDMLGLEAVRLFLPDVFWRLPNAINALTFGSNAHDDVLEGGINSRARHTEQIDRLVASTEKESAALVVVNAMLHRLFPAGDSLRRMGENDFSSQKEEDPSDHLASRRVAHGHVLRLYLERIVGPDLLDFNDAEEALARMADRNDLESFLRSLEPSRWPDVVSNLLHLEDRFRPEHVAPSVVVLLNLLPDIPESLASPYPVSAHGVRQVVGTMLSRIRNGLSEKAELREMLSEVKSLSGKLELVNLIKHEVSGLRLVTTKAAADFESRLREQIRTECVSNLCREVGLSRILRFVMDTASPSEEPLRVDESSELTFALLWSARRATTTGSLDTRAQSHSVALHWELILQLYGGEEIVASRIERLKAEFENLQPWIKKRGIPPCDARDLIKLADTYLDGSRSETD
ncbi:MAG: P-loop NTPase fold protein [Gammaproteobacteria bacterium]|nr:P-loop NTPase fold protein [Gammaproteobacteria bacterium]